MSKFKEFFSEWVMFNDGHTFVISAEDYTKPQALHELENDVLTWQKYAGVKVQETHIKEDKVRFCFGLDQELDYLGHPQPMWFLQSKKKGSKKVWVVDMWDVQQQNKLLQTDQG